MKRTVRQIIAGLLVVAMIAPFPAYAGEYDLSQGSVTINGATESTEQTVVQNEVRTPDPTPVITQSSEVTSNNITINDNGQGAEVTIQDVNIDTGSETPAITVNDSTTGSTDSHVTIHVSGDNTVQSDGTAIES